MDKRRLPVIGSSPSPDPAGEERPPWHWVGFGAVAIFVVWLPLSYLAEVVRVRITTAWLGEVASEEDARRAIAALDEGARAKMGLVLFAAHGTALFLAAFAGGLIVGRFGDAKVGVREAALAGLAASLVACAVARPGLSWVLLVPVVVATAGAALGGAVGGRARRPN